MSDIQRNPTYRVHDSAIDEILCLLHRSNFKMVHYVGYADERLIKSLIAEKRYAISLMDYWDRYHREVHFWDGDELDLSHLVVPEWLDGIPSYFEGAPEHDVLLQDIPWQYEGQFDAIVAFESRPAPLCVVLFGEAEMDTGHPSYSWQQTAFLRIGLMRNRNGEQAKCS
jgi:hypothetical protein